MTGNDAWAAARLAVLRHAHHLTQRELAELAGIDRSRYNGMERGHYTITSTYAERLAPHLGVPPEELLPPNGGASLPTDPLALLQELLATVRANHATLEDLIAKVEALERGDATPKRGRGGR